MKKVILISGLALSLIATPALANCPSGNCAVEINCTTGVVTYTDAPPRTNTPALVIPAPVTATHQVVIQTANSSIGTSGTYEQVQQLVQQVIEAPKAPQLDPCASGGCNKIIVNATTGITQVLPLSPADIQQRLVDQYMNYARQLELAIAAKDVAIQPYVAPTIGGIATNSVVDTALMVNQPTDTLTATTAVTALSNVVMATKSGVKVIKKENGKVLIRKKGKK
jgi:hypothetical protein